MFRLLIRKEMKEKEEYIVSAIDPDRHPSLLSLKMIPFPDIHAFFIDS